MSGSPARAAPAAEPRRIEIHLGTLCNNRCVFCMSTERRDRREPWAALERVKEELRHFHEKGCRAVGFLGGEPTVYPHILECVAYARELGYGRIALCTNAVRLADETFCGKLVGAGVTRVSVSVHSHREEIEDGLMTRVPGNFKKKVAAIRNLARQRRRGFLKDNLSLNPVLCRPNLRELQAYIEFFCELGAEDIRFNFIWPHGDVRNDRAWIPSLAETMPEIVRVMLLNETRRRRRLTFGAVPKCALRLAGVSGRLGDYLAGKYLDEACFDPPNDVSMATRGERPEDRFVWQEVKRDVFKTRPDRCAGCRFAAGCDGVWKSYAEIYGVSELEPV